MSDSTNSAPFPHYVDTRKVFSQKGIFGGELSKDKLPRLALMLADGNFKAEAKLVFSNDDRGRRLIEGWVRAQVSVACQRCLMPLELSIADDIRLALVSDEDKASKLDDDVEPWIEPEFKLDPVQIVEEQLLLSMPLAAYHEIEICGASQTQFDAPEASKAAAQDKSEPNAFAILKELKMSGSSD